MIPAAFEYHRAGSVSEAVELLAANRDAKLLAGGHSLLPMMKLRLAAPAVLIDIGGISELSFIKTDAGQLTVGAMTTHAEVAASSDVRQAHAALAEAAASIGDVQVRNCGTLGGSVAHADPAADYAAVLMALDAEVDVVGPDGERSVDAADLFTGLLETSLAPNEVLVSVRFPASAGRSVYEKFAQPASGFAIVGVAADIATDDAGACTAARIAATGIADRPLRLSAVETALSGATLETDGIALAAQSAAEGIAYLRDDMYAGEDYRRHLLSVLVGRAVERAAS